MGMVTWLQDGWGSDPGGRNGMFLCLKTLGAPPSFNGQQIFYSVLKMTALEFYHQRPSSAVVQNKLKCISPPSVCFRVVGSNKSIFDKLDCRCHVVQNIKI